MSDSPDTLMSLFVFDQASMTADQVGELSEWILAKPENTQAFIRNVMFHRHIHESFVRSDNAGEVLAIQSNDPAGQTDQLLNPEMWRLLSEDQETAPSVNIPAPPAQPVEIVKNRPRTIAGPRKINKFSAFAAIASLAALLCILTYIHLVPVTVHEEVATLIDTLDAQWAETVTPMKKGSRLVTNTEPFMLRKGIAELLFDNDIKVLIEAPAEFVLITDDQVKLTYGRLYAVVPQQTIGFTVTTPNAKVIDLGTEFGVQVDFSRTTEVHVVKGKTTLLADQKGQMISLQVNEGAAKKISDRTSDVQDILCDTGLFIREIESDRKLIWRGGPLELADMIGGGNGLGTGRPDTGIRWEDGSFVSTHAYHVGQREQGTTDFIPVPESMFIEGVFVPNSTKGPVQFSTDDQLRWDLPETPGQYCYNIHNSGGISRGNGRIPFHTQILDGKLCGTPNNPVISMHANAAVTFNLQEIRQYYKNFSLTSFSAVCGYSETYFEYGAKVDPDIKPQASFYVLVDGQQRFAKPNHTPQGKACPVEVDLLPEDRYLTLAVTGGDDQKVSYDWCLFGQPRIRIE